jgi:hypothetical protein
MLLNLFVRAFVIILISQLDREMGLRLPIILLSLAFFSNRQMTDSLWDSDNSPVASP